MNRAEFIEKVKSIDLDKSEFAVLSGGSMLMMGLRERTADLDLAISEEAAQRIKLDNYPSKNGEGRIFIIAPDIEMMRGFEDMDKVEIDGFWCESPQSILAFKKKMQREKDGPDIVKLEEYLGNQ